SIHILYDVFVFLFYQFLLNVLDGYTLNIVYTLMPQKTSLFKRKILAYVDQIYLIIFIKENILAKTVNKINHWTTANLFCIFMYAKHYSLVKYFFFPGSLAVVIYDKDRIILFLTLAGPHKGLEL
ncbi:hypothetical protein ACJX0J_030527, partial [Zea mays]